MPLIRSSETADNAGDIVVVNYRTDSDITQLFNRIKNIMTIRSKAKLKDLTSKRNVLMSRLNHTQYANKRSLDISELICVDREIKQIQSESQIKEFITRTGDIIQSYTANCINIQTTFGSADVPMDDFKMELLSRFIQIAIEYTEINVIFDQKHKFNCKNCGIDLSTVEQDEETSCVVCPNCNLIRYLFQKFNRVDELSTSDYEDSVNFWRGILRFQAKENIELPSKLYADLNDYFGSYGLPIGSVIKNMPFAESRTIVGKRIMRKALANKGYEELYEDINLIIFEYWGWEPPDISHLEEKLMDHYHKTESVFKRIKGKRKASINIPWRLKKHLLICSYPVAYYDFKLVDTREIIEYYEQVFNTMCMESGDPEIVEGYMKINA